MSACQLVKDGRWLVPPDERPAGWEAWPVPVFVTHAGVPDILRCRCGKPLHHIGSCFFRALRTRTVRIKYVQHFQTEIIPAIAESAKASGADAELEMAARILFAGIYNYRSPNDICKFTGSTRDFAERIMYNCLRYQLWLPTSVRLGDCDENYGDLEFWLLAMVANGEIRYNPTSNTFQALPTQRRTHG